MTTKLSPRASLLVIVTGATLGWGAMWVVGLAVYSWLAGAA
jgi:hypothetical protein